MQYIELIQFDPFAALELHLGNLYTNDVKQIVD